MATQADAQELAALRALSASIGLNPHMTQAAGGNTSLKAGDTLWIKASGTWLKDALSDDIMVPVAMAPLLKAVDSATRRPTSRRPSPSTTQSRGLRPSIETTVHALMPQRVVLHVHCVDTISLAVQADGEAEVARRLRGIEWAYVPYFRPGLPLARGIAEKMRPGVDVLILGNHGLVVAAETVAEADRLLHRVRSLLARPARGTPRPIPPPWRCLPATVSTGCRPISKPMRSRSIRKAAAWPRPAASIPTMSSSSARARSWQGRRGCGRPRRASRRCTRGDPVFRRRRADARRRQRRRRRHATLPRRRDRTRRCRGAAGQTTSPPPRMTNWSIGTPSSIARS